MAIASSMSLAQLEAILDATAEGVIAVDPAGRVVLFNAAAGAILRRRAKDALGKAVQDVVPNSRLPDVVRSGEDELDQYQDAGATTILTSRVVVRGGDGEIEGAVAIFRDVSEVQALTGQLRTARELRELSEAIIRCSQEAISIADAKGNTVLVNPAYTRLMGLTEAQVIGRPVTADIAEGESVHLRVLRTRKAIRGARLRVGPHAREVVVNAAPLLVGGELRGSSCAGSSRGARSTRSSARGRRSPGRRSSRGRRRGRRRRCSSSARAARARSSSPTPSTTPATGATAPSSA